jgi:hypothetical protein
LNFFYAPGTFPEVDIEVEKAVAPFLLALIFFMKRIKEEKAALCISAHL